MGKTVKFTLIPVYPETREKLRQAKIFRKETYSELIERLLAAYEYDLKKEGVLR